MWLGKVAIICYVFSLFVLFFGYYLNTIFQDPVLTANTNITYNALNTLAASFALNQQINTSLIFGDFIAGLTVLFGILTGGPITELMTLGIPFMDGSIQLLFRIVFALSSVLLWIYIVANRSV